MLDATWEHVHNTRKWGSYPKEELVRWASKATPGSRILDLGSGQGASTWFLAREGFSPVALDGSFSALAKGRDRLNAEGLPYAGVAADLTQLPFKAKSFDAVVDVVSSAHNTPECMFEAFLEVSRVLRPGGQLFSVLPTNKCSRRTFTRFTTTFLEMWEVIRWLELTCFTKIMVLRSSYQLDPDCLIDNWIVTAQRKE